MEQQRQGPGGNRRRRRKHRGEARSNPEPVLIAARRPNSPILPRNNSRSPIVASAAPVAKPERVRAEETSAKQARTSDPPQRRTARIVQAPGGPSDEAERNRQRLLARLMASDGRGAITRAAKEYKQAGFEFPLEQAVQLQLLEHFDEEYARAALEALTYLLEREPPLKKPVLEQRLRRLEEYAEESQIRERAAELRRALRARGDGPPEARTRLSS
jgi:hypothetical protein